MANPRLLLDTLINFFSPATKESIGYEQAVEHIDKALSSLENPRTYRAKLHSTSADIIPVVLKNTIGAVSIRRESVGVFSITSPSAFDLNKSDISEEPIHYYNTETKVLYTITWHNIHKIELTTKKEGVLMDGLLNDFYVEFNLYT